MSTTAAPSTTGGLPGGAAALDASAPGRAAADGSDASGAPGEVRGRWGFGHVPALDGLRGAAVAAVLAFHAGHLDGGYLGVDLFFVLSGYLITSLLLAEHDRTGGIGLRAFWVRRARRLLPAVLVLLAGVAVYSAALARSVDLDPIRADALATLFYVANWHTILRGTPYADISLAPSPLQHTWSLAIEEQFYLLWPLVVVGLSRLGRGARAAGSLARRVGVVAALAAVVAAGLFVGLHAAGASDNRVYEGTDTRATALLLGVALAAARVRLGRQFSPTVREAAGVGAALGLGAMWVGLGIHSPFLYRGGLPLASLLAVVVVAAAADRRSPVLGRLFSFAPLRGLGVISYGVYLWHWPIYQWIDQRNGHLAGLPEGYVLHGPALLAAKVGVSLTAAIASYVLVEQPIRHGWAKGWAGAGLAAAGVAAAAVAVLWGTAGAPHLPDPAATDEVGQPVVHVAEAPNVMFVGDSVAMSLVRPVVADPERYGINPINRTVPGCSIVTQGRESTNFAGQPSSPVDCAPDPAGEVKAADPDLVFFLVGARPNDYIHAPDGRWVRACEPAFDDAYRSSTAKVLQAFGAGGRPVVVGTIVAGGANALKVEGSEERSACVNRILADLVRQLPNGHLVDLSDLVCPDGPRRPCREELAGVPIRTDGLHYDPGEGGAKVADWVVRKALAESGLQRGS